MVHKGSGVLSMNRSLVGMVPGDGATPLPFRSCSLGTSGLVSKGIVGSGGVV